MSSGLSVCPTFYRFLIHLSVCCDMLMELNLWIQAFWSYKPYQCVDCKRNSVLFCVLLRSLRVTGGYRTSSVYVAEMTKETNSVDFENHVQRLRVWCRSVMSISVMFVSCPLTALMWFKGYTMFYQRHLISLVTQHCCQGADRLSSHALFHCLSLLFAPFLSQSHYLTLHWKRNSEFSRLT